MLYFVRHGESQGNTANIFAGPGYPAPLTKKGRSQAAAAGQDILARQLIIDRIIASPMERAQQTAEIIAETISYPATAIQFDARLAEHDMGSLNGKSMAGIVSGRQIVEAPGAETPLAFQQRVLEALEEIASLPGNTLIVSHGGVGRIIEASRCTDVDLRDFYDIAGYPHATVVALNI